MVGGNVGGREALSPVTRGQLSLQVIARGRRGDPGVYQDPRGTMSHRLSKEELDEQFEQFLKESLSDDSFDNTKKSAVLENLGKPKVKRIKKKDASPWWAAEDDSDDGGHQSRSYLKPKKQQSNPSVDIAKSGSDDRKKPDTSCHIVQQNPCSSSLNRTLDKCMKLEQYYKSKRESCLDPQDDPHSSDSPESPDDLAGTSRSFLKSQSMSQPIEEVEEEDHVEEMQQSIDPLITSIEKDSLEIDESVVASGPNHTFHGVGLDTLEEQQEKERFFARLEKGASSTIDYSKLNKELDSTDSTQLTAVVCNVDSAKTEDDENKDENKDLSVNYSEDFEDEPEAINKPEKQNEALVDSPELKNPTLQEEEKPGMLAKVMLLDSMDSTIDTQKLLQQTQDETESVTQQGTNEAMGTVISNQYTNSDVEALHQAYQNLDQSMEDTDEQNNYIKATDHTSTSFEDTGDSKAKSLKITGDSDMSTVDELMQPIRGEEGFNVMPLSGNMQTNHGQLLYSQHKSMEKDPKDLLAKKRALDYLHDWSGGKSESRNVFPAPEVDLHYKNTKKAMAPDPQSQQQHVASQEASHSEMFASHQGERSHVSKYGNDPAVRTSTSGLLHNKLSNKTVKSPTSLLTKGQSTQYSYVKSSGYGKASSQMKQCSNDDKNLPSKEFHMETKGRSPTDQKPKGILSATRTIRFAENSTSFSKDSRTSTTPQQHQEIPAQINLETAMDYQRISVPVGPYGVASENDSAIHYSNISGSDLTVLQRLQNVEEKLNAGHVHTVTFKGDFSRKEEECKQEIDKMRRKYEEEINELKQDNFMLQTKLRAREEKNKSRSHLLGDQKAPIAEEKMLQIRQEIEEQETLLQGYQQENERLYQQVKELTLKNKQNGEQMFNENQALKADIISLREKLKVNSATLPNQFASHGSESNTQSFTELIAELRALQKKETSLLDDIAIFKQDKQALEVDLVHMRKERDLLKAQLSNTSDDKSYAMKIMEETYKQEISRLNKRLQWFAENQELLDKDAGRLRDAYEQIESLKIQVEKLRHDAGNQSVQQQKRLKDRPADAKHIQDLERQVKEMEAIIKRRHPNSIPALMYAAAAVSETDSSTKSSTVAFLERRVQKLETDLESKDEEAKKTLRGMEQQFQKIKIQYESQINELEELLAQRPVNEPQKHADRTIKVRALEQELSIFKDAHHTTVTTLRKEIDTLKEKNLFLEHELIVKDGNITSNTKAEEMPDQARLKRLNQELITKSKEIQALSKTVERLQKERMLMLSVKPHSSKAAVVPPFKGSTAEAENFPATLDDKLYQPDTFADFHISDLQQENKRLEVEIRRLSQEMHQQKTNYETSLANAEHAIKRLKCETAEQVAALKQTHQREMEKLICQHALEHSSSRVAERSSKISTQEILIKHLQKQVSELQKDRESLAVLHVREETLQKEMAKLLDDLKVAKECHSPEMKHFLTLESKIKHMEIRHSQREQELQQIIQQTRHVAEATQVREIDKWKKLAQQKNVELERFRTELDAILDVLRVLQRQGVVIPTSTSEGSRVHWKA